MAKMPFSVSQGKEHPDRGYMLLDSCRRTRVLFNVCRLRDRLDILQAAEARALAPIKELADGMIVSDPRVLVADGNGKKFEVSLGRFRADIGEERWNCRLQLSLGVYDLIAKICPESDSVYDLTAIDNRRGWQKRTAQ
jgi:hypothetical protein